MRKRPVLLVAFLLVLYIVPMICGPSYTSPTILTEPNTTKEFSTSEYLDESPYSANGFYETLEDDVFYTPDGWYDETPILAYGGGGTEGEFNDWYDTFEIDAESWSTFSGDAEYIQFQAEHVQGSIEGFEYAFYARSIGGNGPANITNHDGGFLLTIDQDANYTWYNGSYWGETWTKFQVAFLTEQIIAGDAIQFDYMEVSFHIMPLLGNNHYGDSFYNVSDWFEGTVNEGSETITTDNDVMSIQTDGDSANDADYFYTTLEPITYEDNFYLEMRYKMSDLTGDLFKIYISDAFDGIGGLPSPYKSYTLTESSDWITSKFNLGSDYTETSGTIATIETVLLRTQCDLGIAPIVYFDYIRIGPSNEMGWQHDGSTTYGLTTYDGTVVSDGDSLNFSAPVGVTGYWDLSFDKTTTLAYIDPNYYPFMKYFISDCSDVNAWAIRHYYDGGHYYGAYADDTIGINYENLLAGTGGTNDRYKMRIWCNPDSWFTLDYLKIYSIADFTVYEVDDEATSDVLYTHASILHCTSVTNDIISLGNDIAISVDTSTYNVYNASFESGADNFRFRELTDTDIYHDTGQANDTLDSTTLTDYEFMFYGPSAMTNLLFIDAHRWNLIDSKDIIFPLPQWHLIDSVIVYFWLDISTLTIDSLLVLLGLALIPLSTCFLVYGGKKSMSLDKMFFFIIMFIFGWALIIGGIM